MDNLKYNGLEIPEFLNLDFFHVALKNGLNSSKIVINEISFLIGNANGNGYTSKIYRAVINYSNESKNCKISLLIKVMSATEDTMGNLNVFDRECKMYLEILPKLENLFNNKVKFGPKCFYASEKPKNIFVFEDMKSLGYVLDDRIVGFDEQHTKAVLDKIAKFHAASMVLFKKEPKLNDFNMSLFHADFDQNIKDTIFLENVKYLQKYLKEWENYDSIVKKLEAIEKVLYEKCLEVFNRKGVCALSHGDLWADNILFKRDGQNRIVDVVFIDYQVSYFGSLGLDLQNLLNNGIQIDVLKSKRYDFLHYYYAILSKTLENQNYTEIPKWEDFMEEIKSTEFYGFVTMEAYLPLTTVERVNANESPSLDILQDKDLTSKLRDKSFKSKRMIETLKYSLNRFNELGVLD